MSTSMNFATIIMTLTPHDTNYSPLVLKSDTLFNEEEFLGEPQPDKDRTRWFASNDGVTGQYLDIFAIAGKRDLTIIDGSFADLLQNYAYANPQPMFDFDFRYQRNDQDNSQIRTHSHKDCKFTNHPARVMSNDIVVTKFTLHYGTIKILDVDGNPV